MALAHALLSDLEPEVGQVDALGAPWLRFSGCA